ncbi:MAG: SulP family inorganic anion transporter, partial [Saprospiraceae bacterium]|nr:SulP family inorganic anion transporter [Saprospiraceae bacterium]
MKKSLAANLKSDIPSSIVVFLVALPLCLGIALASGAPPISGVIAGIVGGIVVGILSGSHVSVSGPAAGLAAVVLAAIATLGGIDSFDVFLLAVFLSGIIQLIIGLAKGGIIANYIPSNVIKGLLAAIGVILILKQIPHAFGIDKDAFGDLSFQQMNGENTFTQLSNIFSEMSWGAFLLCASSMIIMIVWKKTPLQKFRFFPASLFVVILGVLVNMLYESYAPDLFITKDHLVKLPEFKSPVDLLTFPDFGSIGNPDVWIAAITIALVASLETLLNLEAVENIDPQKRQASPNRELLAQGTGNMISGLIGGLPLTSVIVRSSANIDSGAATKMSAIIHGFLLVISVLLFAPILGMIPNASLAAILLLIGYKLARISLFQEMYKKGMDQFIPFVVTILAIVFTDLLTGVLIGLCVSIFFILKSNYRSPFVMKREKMNTGETMVLKLPNQVSFLNKASIKDILWALEENAKVIIDAKDCEYIDSDVLDILKEFKTVVAVEKNIQLSILGLREDYELGDNFEFVNVLDKDALEKMTTNDIIDILKNGNDRFMKGEHIERYVQRMGVIDSKDRHPMAVILSCVDSHTSPELIFDMDIGEIISIRIAANVVNQEVIESIEFACQKNDIKLILVLGNSDCGMIETILDEKYNLEGGTISKKIE